MICVVGFPFGANVFLNCPNEGFANNIRRGRKMTEDFIFFGLRFKVAISVVWRPFLVKRTLLLLK